VTGEPSCSSAAVPERVEGGSALTTIWLPDAELVPVPLVLEERVTLGPQQAGSSVLPDRVSVGRPSCQALDASSVDEDARPFLGRRADHEYYLVGLTCSFMHDVNAPFLTAWLQLSLSLTDDGPDATTGHDEATAWSLAPTVLFEPMDVSQTSELDAELKLTGFAGISTDIGVGGKRETEAHFVRKEIFLEGLGEGSSKPVWAFTKTAVSDIRGPFRLRAVTEIPYGRSAAGVVTVGASLGRKLMGLSYSSPLKNVPPARHLVIGAAPGNHQQR
jgi:hypothetical protein